MGLRIAPLDKTPAMSSANGSPSTRVKPRAPPNRATALSVDVETHAANVVPGSPAALAASEQNLSRPSAPSAETLAPDATKTTLLVAVWNRAWTVLAWLTVS